MLHFFLLLLSFHFFSDFIITQLFFCSRDFFKFYLLYPSSIKYNIINYPIQLNKFESVFGLFYVNIKIVAEFFVLKQLSKTQKLLLFVISMENLTALCYLDILLKGLSFFQTKKYLI
jgi:hypothetical protein